MSKWVIMQLGNKGEVPGKRLFTAAQSKEMWSPITPMPIGDPPPALAAAKANFSAYGLGWTCLRDYRGYKLVSHRRPLRHGFASYDGPRFKPRRHRAD